MCVRRLESERGIGFESDGDGFWIGLIIEPGGGLGGRGEQAVKIELTTEG